MGMDYYESMMQFHRALGGLALACGAAAALAQTVPTPAASAPAAAASAPAAPSRMTARLMYELLIGELLFRGGEAPKGTAYVLNAARRVGDESLFKRATEMAIQSRSGPAALEATRAWRQAAPNSAEAGQYELQVLIVLGRIAETEEPARRFLATLPESDKVPFITALPALYQRVPDKAEAARVVESALSDAIKQPALAPAAWTAIGRIRFEDTLPVSVIGQPASAKINTFHPFG